MSGLTERLSLVPQLMPGRPPAEPSPVRLSLDGVPKQERAGVFREFFGREVMRYDVETSPDVEFHLDVTLRALPGVLMMSGQGYGSCNRRTRELITLDGSDDIGMVVNLGGLLRGTHSEQEIVLEDGEATLVSLEEVCSYTHRPPGGILALRLSRRHFAPLVPAVDDRCWRTIPRDTPALRLLTDYLRIVENGQGIAGPELQHLAAAHIGDLMALAVGATRDAAATARERGLRAARLDAIKHDIATNLDRADLSVGSLARRHACTPRFVQRLFEGDGTTLTEYVLAQRLARAHRMLTDPRRSGEKVSAIALDAGFGDISYFNRVFRRHYGDTPSGVRGQAPALSGTMRAETGPLA